MKLKISLLVLAVLIIAACSSKKVAKSTASSTVATASTPTTSTVSSTPATVNTLPNHFSFIDPASGIIPPGNGELTAIQEKFKDVTMEKLNEGYSVYTQGACLNCHSPQNIYKIKEEECKDIIGNMAQKAAITDAQRDAVYKYVLAMKATQPK